MTLVVEDGTGRFSAESFISVAYADAYHLSRGNADWAAADSTAKKEEALRRASTYLSDAFAWPGYEKNPREQALAWPRYDVIDAGGWPVDPDSVPEEIQRATAEIALRELATPGSMTPDYTAIDRVKREKVGPLEVEYDLSRTDAGAARPVLSIVRDIVRPLLGNTTGSRISGSTTRV